MKLAVIGATGMVGTIMIKLLEERKFPISELLVVASKNSIGNLDSLSGSHYQNNWIGRGGFKKA